MKTLPFKFRDIFTPKRQTLVAAACLLSSVLSSSASVTVQGWWHLDNAQPITDSSGNGLTFGSAYSTAPAAGGQVAAQVINNGAGGPLDSTGYTSSTCVRFGVGVGGKRQSAMWGISYNPPATNFGIEIWVLPQDNGIAGGTGGWIFSSGQTGGVALRINAPLGGGPSYIDAFDVGNNLEIGDQAVIDTNEWMHIAIVNDSGVTTFYTNGVPCGASVTNGTTTSKGDVYIGSPGDNNAYDGYLDEARMFTFNTGAFTTNDMLLRPAGPNLLAPAQSATVWGGGAGPFNVIASFDFNTNPVTAQTYQWEENGVAIAGATNSSYSIPVVSGTDSGSNLVCVITVGGISVTSTPPAQLTVVSNNSADVAAYQSLISATPGILAYFPVDNDTNTVVTNIVDATHNGTLGGDAGYDGRTNRAFGQRALSFDGNAYVQVPNDTAYEFDSGFGTIEAVIYLSQAPGYNATIFSENLDGSPSYYSLSSDPTGDFLVYGNDTLNPTAATSLSWAVPGGLVGQLLDVALVIDNTTNVTAYVNGQSLGSQAQTAFGTTPGGSFWIGSTGTSTSQNGWIGSIDELAIIGTNLSVPTIQAHYTKFVFGTNVVPPVIVGQSTGKTVLAGGSPELTVTATGGLPLSYQWTSNTIPIPGATTSSLVISNSTTNSSASYAVTITNVFGATNSQAIAMSFTAPAAGYETTVMTDHPSAFWRMADKAGPTAVDSAGLNDAVYSSSGVTYAAGGPSFDTNAGVVLDGASGRAVTPANFPDINPSGPFTIEFWAKLSAYQSVATTGKLYSPLSSMPRPARTGGWEWYMGGNSSGYEFHSAEAGNYSLITADNNEPPVGDWWYLTGIWDGTNMYLYVNGQLGNYAIDAPGAPAGVDNFASEGLGQTEFVPNTSVPLYIGSRSDNVDFFDGGMADIAFYDYALTSQQVTNHWKAAWLPATVAVGPGITNVEGTTITLEPTSVSGLPNTYQWFHNGTALSATAVNSDGSLHYPDGVSSSNLVVSQTKPTLDSGTYFLGITNPVADAISSNINVVITPNTNPPSIVSATALGVPNTSGQPGGTVPFVVKVVYSARIDPTTGGTLANYSISPSVTISKVTLLGSGPNDLQAESLAADWREALLVTSGLTPGEKYTVSVSGLKDQSQTPLSVPTLTESFHAPTVTPGVAEWDYYYLGTNNTSGADAAPVGLQADVNYMNYAPQTNVFLTALDTDQITGGDLNTIPGFIGIGDYYGDVVSGWLTPTVTGNYTFFIAADDSAVLELSTNSSAAGLTQIAILASANGSYQETNSASGGIPPQDSTPIPLTAGTAYYFELIHEEINGGDYARVAWRSDTDSTPASSLTAIPGTYLSAYEAVSAQPPQFTAPGLSNGNFTLSWSGGGVLQESTNLTTWIDVPGGATNTYSVSVQSGTNALFFRIAQ